MERRKGQFTFASLFFLFFLSSLQQLFQANSTFRLKSPIPDLYTCSTQMHRKQLPFCKLFFFLSCLSFTHPAQAAGFFFPRFINFCKLRWRVSSSSSPLLLPLPLTTGTFFGSLLETAMGDPLGLELTGLAVELVTLPSECFIKRNMRKTNYIG